MLKQQLEVLINGVVDFLKRTSLPGFFGVPLYDVFSLIIKEFKKDDILTRANGMAFNFFLSIFPILLILIALLPQIPIDGFEKTFYAYIFGTMPEGSVSFLRDTIDGLRRVNRGNLISGSLFLAFFFASNGILSMVRGFEKSYNLTFQNRHFIAKRVVSLWLLFLMGMLVTGGCVLILLGQYLKQLIVDYTHLTEINNVLLFSVKWVFVFSFIYTLCSMIYRFAPAFRKKTTFLNPGSTLTTILIIVTTIFFSVYVNRFDTYNRVYGSIGAIIVTMIWIQLNCFVLLVGFELNSSIALNRDLRSALDRDEQITGVVT